MTLLTGLTPDGIEIPVQVGSDGRLVAEGLTGPQGGVGPAGATGPTGPAGPEGPPGRAMVLATAQNSTSGTIDFTGIPSWVKRVTVMFYRLSTNGSSQIILQLGAGSIATSAYNARVTSINGANVTNANGQGNAFGVTSSGNSNASNTVSGQIIFSLLGSNSWCCCGSTMDNTQQSVQWIQAGDVPLGGTLDRIRITTVNGTDTFDAGSISILYEG